jgi:hypothetical protein
VLTVGSETVNAVCPVIEQHRELSQELIFQEGHPPASRRAAGWTTSAGSSRPCSDPGGGQDSCPSTSFRASVDDGCV